MRKFESKLLQHLYDKRIANNPKLVKFYEDEDQRVTVGSEIYNLRTQAGLTQSQVAEIVGTPPEMIDDIELADYEDNRDEIINQITNAIQAYQSSKGSATSKDSRKIDDTRGSLQLYQLLDSQLMIHLQDFEKGTLATAQELSSNNPVKGSFAEKLLLYDRVIIPTIDFSIIPILLVWLGSSTLENLLDQGAIGFVRNPSFIGYQGGKGPCSFQIIRPHVKPSRQIWISSAFADSESALEYWIYNASFKLGQEQRQRIIEKILSNTKNVNLQGEMSNKILREEIYEDIMNSSLSQLFTSVHFDNLQGVGENQVRCLQSYNPQQHDDVNLLLNLSAMNLDIYLASLVGATDLTSSSNVASLLSAKAERFLKKAQLSVRTDEILKDFSRILNLSEVNIGEAITAGSLGFHDISQMRVSSDFASFRKWFHENIASNPTEANREYVKAISKPEITDRLPMKKVKYVVTSLDSLSPYLEQFVSSPDNFIWNLIIKGNSQKYLIDELIQSESTTTDNAMQGNDMDEVRAIA